MLSSWHVIRRYAVMSVARLQAEDSAAAIGQLLERRLADDTLPLPQLPCVAVRIVRTGIDDATNAEQLSAVIDADESLRDYLLQIAASAAKRPATPVASLRHAVAWLGFNEVANIAFTLALQVQLLDVPGEQRRARALWRHALASALWARQLAQLLREDSGSSYLCGLLHDIGKVIALGALNTLARQLEVPLSGCDYERLIDTHHRALGERAMSAWQLPPRVLAVAVHWQDYAACSTTRLLGNIVHVAHRLADYTLIDCCDRARDLLVTDAAYRDLGLRLEDGGSLFESAAAINAELDLYLAP